MKPLVTLELVEVVRCPDCNHPCPRMQDNGFYCPECGINYRGPR